MSRSCPWLFIPVLALCVGSCGPAGEFSRQNRAAESLFDVIQSKPDGAEAIELATDEFDPDNRTRGIVRLARSDAADEPASIALYADATRDEDAAVRRAAALALAGHGGPEHVPVLIPLLGDEDPAVRAGAATALQFLHDPAAAEPLIQRLRQDTEPDPLVRTAAAEALGQYPQRPVALALIDALDERDLAVNDAASRSLETMTGQQFGLDLASWVLWFEQSSEFFLAGRAYEYPGYSRPRHWHEYFMPWRDIPERTPAPPRGSPYSPAPEEDAEEDNPEPAPDAQPATQPASQDAAAQ